MWSARSKTTSLLSAIFHTAGNPGRHDLDETQELYYPAILRAIAATDYEGYVGQELLPKGDPLAALEQAYKVCDVQVEFAKTDRPDRTRRAGALPGLSAF